MARKGLPKSIIKKYGISKKAWAVFRGQKSSKSSNPRPKKARKVKNVVRRRYSRKRKRRARTIPLLPVIGAVGSFFVGASDRTSPAEGLKRVLQGDTGMAPHMMADIMCTYVGYDPRDGSWRIPSGTVVIGGTLLAHKIMNMLGANRVFANLPPPLNKVRL